MKILLRWKCVAALVLSILFCGNVLAESPTVMLQSVANQMMASLEKNKSQLKGNPKIIREIVDRVLIPHIDINRMSGMVVGRQAWDAATPAQRREFVELFKRRVINTYSHALASYDDDKLVIYPMRGNQSGRFASVDSAVIRKSGQKINISYKLINNGGAWKVYDFSVEGVSIVSNYHSQFANVLANGGMAQLNDQLRRR